MKATKVQHNIIHTVAGQCLGVRLRLINRIVGNIYNRALKPHGIKATQFTVLIAVSASEAQTSKELSRLLHMDASTFSRALGILKRNNWLDTEPSGEGKILTVKITAQGLKKIELAYPDWQKAQTQAVEFLGDSTANGILESGTKYFSPE